MYINSPLCLHSCSAPTLSSSLTPTLSVPAPILSRNFCRRLSKPTTRPARPDSGPGEAHMPTKGAKARSQSVSRRTVLKKVSNESGVGSSTSSAAWSTREARLSTSAASTIGHLIRPIKPDRPAVESSSSLRIPQLAPPIEFRYPSNAEQARRKCRRVESWLKEQQRLNSSMDEAARELVAKAAGTPCNPYLAYPGMPKYASWQDGDDENDNLGSFVIVEEEDSRGSRRVDPPTSRNAYKFEPSSDELLPITTPLYASSTRPSSLRARRPASILSVSSWRNLPFTKTLSAQRSPSIPGEPIDLSTPPASLKTGPVRRRSPIPEDFLNTDPSATSNFGKTAQNKASSGTLRASDIPRSSIRKRLGNLMRHHGNASSNSESPTSTKDSSSPRPSTSASARTATTSTAVENELRSVGGSSPNRFLPKFNVKLSKATHHPPDDLPDGSPTRSSFSTVSQHEEPASVSPAPAHSVIPSESPFSSSLSKRRSQSNIFRDKCHNASSSALSTLSIGSIGSIATNINGRAGSVFTGSSTVRRKRLVVSGIAWDDTAAVQGLRRWCEHFGELRQITRMPNGDLHIDFKRADVADTVCRISARVHIADVGSVNMSWISGKKH